MPSREASEFLMAASRHDADIPTERIGEAGRAPERFNELIVELAELSRRLFAQHAEEARRHDAVGFRGAADRLEERTGERRQHEAERIFQSELAILFVDQDAGRAGAGRVDDVGRSRAHAHQLRAEVAVGRREGLEGRDVEPEAGGDLFRGLRFALAIGVVAENEGQLL